MQALYFFVFLVYSARSFNASFCDYLKTSSPFINHLKSEMIIVVCSAFKFTGIYKTGTNPDCGYLYLSGVFNRDYSTTIGIVVKYYATCDFDRVSTWSGQIILHKGKIHTFWIDQNTTSSDSLTSSTRIGRDRICPNKYKIFCVDDQI